MTQADFYILAGQQQQDQWFFACRLTEQLAKKGRSILLQVSNHQEAVALDEYLWMFREEAFVPHTRLDDPEAPIDCPVSIGWQDDPQHHHDVLIQLSDALPTFYSRFHRLVEIVVQKDEVLAYSRKHYRHLKDRGYPINNKDMRLRV